MRVIFYEKPGCINNTRQKQTLAAAGYEVDARDLLAEGWSVESLTPFFSGLEVKHWFNKSAPAVKSGDVVPETLSAEEALQMMVRDPLLIRRPLMIIEGCYYVGFDLEGVHGTEVCPRSHEAGSCGD